jgi:hypothetical protein
MAKKRSPKNGPTQDTQSTEPSRGNPWNAPAKGKPVEIPIPTKRDVMRDLAKVAKPKHRDDDPDA